MWVAVVTSILAFYGRRLFAKRHIYSIMLYLDGFGAAMSGIQGAAKAWDLEFGIPAAPVMLGITTAIGGGILRDTLAGRTNLLMKPELYAVPVTVGCIAFVSTLHLVPDYRKSAAVICILATFAWRAAAIHWNLRMPMLARTGGNQQETANHNADERLAGDPLEPVSHEAKTAGRDKD